MYLRIYTHNVRVATPTKRGIDERPWGSRVDAIVDSIKFHTFGVPSIVCLQETLIFQINDILDRLGNQWSFIGIPRVENGEMSAILYMKSQWTLLESNPFWLSPTPNIPSKGWDAKYVRIATMAKFKHIDTSIELIVWCAHFDHVGQQARLESARLLLSLMKGGNEFLVGDFNCEPGSPPYQLLSKHLYDSFSAKSSYGYNYSFTGFSNENKLLIDYIFATISAINYTIVGNDFGYRFSDHRPVIGDYSLSK